MRKPLCLAASLVLIVAPANANPAIDKCVADTTALGAKDPASQCQCFVDALSEDEAEAYAEIGDWESEATDAMKEAGAECFPDLN